MSQQQEQQKYVSATAACPTTWHFDPDCGPEGSALKPLEDELPASATRCCNCAGGKRARDIRKMVEENARV